MVIKTHPKFDAYEFDSETGKYRRVGSTEWYSGSGCDDEDVYLRCSISSKNKEEKKTVAIYRAIWTCFNGDIADGNEIDHLDNNPLNNKLSNLQSITVAENRKRRNHDFLKKIGGNATANKRKIKATNLETNETKVFKSKSNCAKYYGCSAGLVYNICEKKNRCKSYMKKYTFEYTDDEVNTIVPDERIGKKQVRKIPQKTEEEKKNAQKEATKRYYAKKKLISN